MQYAQHSVSTNLHKTYTHIPGIHTLPERSTVVDSRNILPRLLLATWTGLTSCALMAGEDNFPVCIERLQQEARQRGIPDSLVSILATLKPLRRTIELDRSQPEFVQTFAGYFNKRVTDFHVQRGRELLEQNRDFLDNLTRQYGVPAQYLVAFWGLESNFGRNIGKMPVLDTLATLACDARRGEFFSEELFNALWVMNKHRVDADAMQGSWAGAIGQTQFLPSAFLQYGRDGDDDQRVDLWRSSADALTSAAYYLQQLGWQKELRWGREVRLPEDFPYHLAGIDSPRSLSEWQQLGVRKADGSELTIADVQAALLIPSGAAGPKFLVYDNFHIIMKWNRSQFYALAVGILADRINGAGNLYQPPPDSRPLTKQQITELQAQLQAQGFDPGTIDGQLGPQTTSAIRAYQKSQQLQADGFADRELLQKLSE